MKTAKEFVNDKIGEANYTPFLMHREELEEWLNEFANQIFSVERACVTCKHSITENQLNKHCYECFTSELDFPLWERRLK